MVNGFLIQILGRDFGMSEMDEKAQNTDTELDDRTDSE